jgi:hypothetical protein
MFRNFLTVGLLSAVFVLSAPVVYAETAEEQAEASARVQKHIAMHDQMAQAHTKAAACLKAGTTEKECMAQLKKDCKGTGAFGHCGIVLNVAHSKVGPEKRNPKANN